MNNGWIKIHRQLLDWEWYTTPNMVHLFIHLIIKANHEPKKWHGIIIERGQFISGRIQLSKETGISEQSIRTCITKLKSTNELTSKSTNGFTLYSINNYKKWQSTEIPTSESTRDLTNDQPATNQRLTTTKNDKNYKNDKEVKEISLQNLKKSEFKTILPLEEKNDFIHQGQVPPADRKNRGWKGLTQNSSEEYDLLKTEFKVACTKYDWCDEHYAQKSIDQISLLSREKKIELFRKLRMCLRSIHSRPSFSKVIFHEISGYINDFGQMNSQQY